MENIKSKNAIEHINRSIRSAHGSKVLTLNNTISSVKLAEKDCEKQAIIAVQILLDEYNNAIKKGFKTEFMRSAVSRFEELIYNNNETINTEVKIKKCLRL